MKGEGTPWHVFIWVVAIVTMILGGIFWRVEAVNSGLSEVRTDIAVVKTDTQWIKENLQRSPAMSVSAANP